MKNIFKKKKTYIIFSIFSFFIFFYVFYSPVIFLWNISATPLGFIPEKEIKQYTNLGNDAELNNQIQKLKDNGEDVVTGIYFSVNEINYAFKYDYKKQISAIYLLNGEIKKTLQKNTLGYDYIFLFENDLYYATGKRFERYQLGIGCVISYYYVGNVKYFKQNAAKWNIPVKISKEQYIEAMILCKKK